MGISELNVLYIRVTTRIKLGGKFGKISTFSAMLFSWGSEICIVTYI